MGKSIPNLDAPERRGRERGAPCAAALFALLAGLMAAGCSVQYVDEGGVRHVWGLAHVEIAPPAGTASEVQAQQVTTFGLALLRMPETAGLSLGYTRNFSLEVWQETAGELTYSPADPVGFTYKGLAEILEENGYDD